MRITQVLGWQWWPVASTTTKVKRWGNSVGVVIPANIARAERLQPGDIVRVDVARQAAPQGFGMARGAKPFQHIAEGHEDVL